MALQTILSGQLPKKYDPMMFIGLALISLLVGMVGISFTPVIAMMGLCLSVTLLLWSLYKSVKQRSWLQAAVTSTLLVVYAFMAYILLFVAPRSGFD